MAGYRILYLFSCLGMLCVAHRLCEDKQRYLGYTFPPIRVYRQ